MKNLPANIVRMAIGLAALELCGCSKDTLSQRKQACDVYETSGFLGKLDPKKCLTDETTFRIAAAGSATKHGLEISEKLIAGSRELSQANLTLDRSQFPPLSSNVENPILLVDEEGASRNWHVRVELDHVTFDAPRRADGGIVTGWQLSGFRSGNDDDIWSLDIVGVAPSSFAQLDGPCSDLSGSEIHSGCAATVFIDAVTDSGQAGSQLVARGFDFRAPLPDEVFQIFMEQEMAMWDERK